MSVGIESLEDAALFLMLVYEMNPDKTEDEIDAVIMNGMRKEKEEKANNDFE